jgi:hypothetical protein
MITGNLSENVLSELLQQRDVCNYPWQLRPRIPSSRAMSHGKENTFILQSDVAMSLTRWRRYGHFHIKSYCIRSIFPSCSIPRLLSTDREPNGKVYDMVAVV